MGVAALPAIMAVTSAASAAYSVVSSRQMANAQRKQQQQNNARVHQSMIDQYSQMSNAERQSVNTSIEDSIRVQREHAKRRTNINIMAAASGTSGVSLGNMIRSEDQEAGRNFETLLRNREIELNNFRMQAESIRTGAVSQADTRIIQRPSFLEGALQVGSAALSGYGAGSGLKSELQGGV